MQHKVDECMRPENAEDLDCMAKKKGLALKHGIVPAHLLVDVAGS